MLEYLQWYLLFDAAALPMRNKFKIYRNVCACGLLAVHSQWLMRNQSPDLTENQKTRLSVCFGNTAQPAFHFIFNIWLVRGWVIYFLIYIYILDYNDLNVTSPEIRELIWVDRDLLFLVVFFKKKLNFYFIFIIKYWIIWES